MSPLALGLGSSRAFGIAKKTAPVASLKIYDEVAGAEASFANLTTSTLFKNFNVNASIDLPYTSTPLPSISCANVSGSNILTIEMWKYINTAPGYFDIIFEIKYASGEYYFIEDEGSMRSSGLTTGQQGWSTTTYNTWRHYVMVLQNSPARITNALDGNRGVNNDVSSLRPGGLATNTTSLDLRFKDSLYGGLANGFIDEIRISSGDIYNLINNATYTVPTAAFTVDANTKHLFRVKSI